MTAAQRCIVVFVCGLSAIAGQLRADDTAPETPNAPAPNAAEFQVDVDRSALDAKRQPIFTVGVMVLLGITLSGLGLMAVVIVWGHRVRRRSRKPLPDAPRGDDLFYLKSGKNPQRDTTVIPPKRSPDDE